MMGPSAGAFRCLARLSGRRAVATFAIRPQEALLRELWQQEGFSNQTLASQRDATAAIARRQQWGAVPIEACPRTLQTAMQEPCDEARIVTESCHPYRVVYANHKWEELCGWDAGEVVGRHGLAFLQGPDTDRLKVERINSAVKYGERVEVKLVNYKKNGTAFVNRLRVTPLTTSLGQYTHMLGILEEAGATSSHTPAQDRLHHQ